ncbi:MAG: hypothetical protein ACJ76Z_04195 [Thermoleophilaceae bacterium]
MLFRRLCDRCGDLVVCSKGEDEDLVCVRCGGALVGPVVLPTPESYRERCEVITSRHYTGAVAEPPPDDPPSEPKAR